MKTTLGLHPSAAIEPATNRSRSWRTSPTGRWYRPIVPHNLDVLAMACRQQ
ncbi:hypothetical protein [Paraburkholderia sacchari]|uniref:hypothetical protein n=1 Tax=Paraburkholderia sacchari TaxID=159450 RepID=UPI0039A66428